MLPHEPAAVPGRQLELPLLGAGPSATRAAALPASGGEYDPDVYRVLMGALLDHGELDPGHLRALLDERGGGTLPIGGYIDLFLTRGDARRIGERLVASAGLVARRSLQSSTASVILSDGGYRARLDALRAGRPVARSGPSALRYALWDRRLLGRAVDVDTLAQDLRNVVLDRTLDTFPIAAPTQGHDAVALHEQPFVDVWEQEGLPICLPPGLVGLLSQVAGVNRALRDARTATRAVRRPTLVTAPVHFHGGLLHPGEPIPRAVPDNRTLRMRLLMNAPYAAMMAALLLLHRSRPSTFRLRRVRREWVVYRDRARLGEVLGLFDAFARSRRWLPCRRRRGGLDATVLLEVLEGLGVVVRCHELSVLDDRLFGQLRTEAEEMEIHARLAPLADALERFCTELQPDDAPL